MQLVIDYFLVCFCSGLIHFLECRSLLQISQFLPTFLGLLILWMVLLSLHSLVLEKKPALLAGGSSAFKRTYGYSITRSEDEIHMPKF